jgi:hypothetical protein
MAAISPIPMNIPVNPDASVYLVAWLLALVSGLLFGIVPVRQVLRANPYEIVKAGSSARIGQRISVRDILLVVQIAICAVLVTSSMVALRGLARSMHTKFGFDPQNVTLVDTVLGMAGYSEDKMPAMQRRMIDAVQAIPGVTSVGLVSTPPLHMGWEVSGVFADTTTDLRPANAAAQAIRYEVSSEYLQAARTALLMGRNISSHDDLKAPRVAVVNREFARKILGSEASALGSHYKLPDGTRIEVVGIVEDGKYTANLAEDPQPAMFLSILQYPASETCMVVRSSLDGPELASAIRSKLRELDPGLPAFLQTWNEEMNGALFASRMATMSLGVLGMMGAMLSITGIFGMAAYSVSKRLRELGIRIALGAQRAEVLKAAIGAAREVAGDRFGRGCWSSDFSPAGCWPSSCTRLHAARSAGAGRGCPCHACCLGLVATWIPAQRALVGGPL